MYVKYIEGILVKDRKPQILQKRGNDLRENDFVASQIFKLHIVTRMLPIYASKSIMDAKIFFDVTNKKLKSFPCQTNHTTHYFLF